MNSYGWGRNQLLPILRYYTDIFLQVREIRKYSVVTTGTEQVSNLVRFVNLDAFTSELKLCIVAGSQGVLKKSDICTR